MRGWDSCGDGGAGSASPAYTLPPSSAANAEPPSPTAFFLLQPWVAPNGSSLHSGGSCYSRKRSSSTSKRRCWGTSLTATRLSGRQRVSFWHLMSRTLNSLVPATCWMTPPMAPETCCNTGGACCSTLQVSAACCSTLQAGEVCCSTGGACCSTLLASRGVCFSTLQGGGACCSTPLPSGACCSTLRGDVACCSTHSDDVGCCSMDATFCSTPL